MVSEKVTSKIKEIFPDKEVDQNYDEHAACVVLEKLTSHQSGLLQAKFLNMGGCEWYVIPSDDTVLSVVFRHVAFSG